jgi:hypothetical protein
VRDVFEEMKLGFLVDGHTHENIDGCFGYLPKKLRKQNNNILANFMKAFCRTPKFLVDPLEGLSI